MNSQVYFDAASSFAGPTGTSDPEIEIAGSLAKQAEKSWVPLVIAVFSLLVVTVVATDTGETFHFAE